MKASVLAVGTEITSGQIVNQNASWISKQLKSTGFVTSLHITVPDDRRQIEESLKLCAQESDLIFVTGGLGPTSDDFTRDLILKWAGVPAIFDEASWQKVQERLKSRGFPVHDFQKQQCFFPAGGQILENSAGTANAFYLSAHKKHLWALPGPPKEIEAVWKDHIAKALQTFPLDPFLTSSWDLLGLGENQVAFLVEPLLEGTAFEVGYRVHLPYVEFKLSYFQSEKEKLAPWIQKIDHVLKDHTLARNGEDPVEIFCQEASHFSELCISDGIGDALLLKRLQPFLKNLMKTTAFTYSSAPSKSTLPSRGASLRLELAAENSCEFEFLTPGSEPVRIRLESPFQAPLMQERRAQYFVEMFFVEALKAWKKT